MKKILTTILFSYVTIASAVDNQSMDIKISAKVNPGCYLIMNDINLPPKEILSVTSSPLPDIHPYSFNVHCSKGTRYDIKTPVADKARIGIVGREYVYQLYPLYLNGINSGEAIGYRYMIKDPSIRVGSEERFGDGKTNSNGHASSYIRKTATGGLETINLEFEIYYYTFYKPGVYSGSNVFTITF